MEVLMADIQHELKINAPRARVFESLTTPAALERWNRATVTGGEGDWTVAYPGGPNFRWKVVAATKDKIVWRCEEGPGNSKGSETIFTLDDKDNSHTIVRLTHHERSGDDPNHKKCNTLWGILLGRLEEEAKRESV
jgi:uncharacterized protein YndB with AHSA1/START domain